MHSLYRQYRDRADFLTIYIREAHPSDEWQMTVNEKESVCYRQPRTAADRVEIANDFVRRFHYELPLLIDPIGGPIDNPADKIYAGWPERLYIIGADGVIAYKGEPGPFGYHPEEVAAWLAARFPESPAAK